MLTSKALLFGGKTGSNDRAGTSDIVEVRNMTKLMIMIVALALLSGCAGTPRMDVSTGEETAVIEGGPCLVHGPVPIDSSAYEGTLYNIRPQSLKANIRVAANRFEGGNVVGGEFIIGTSVLVVDAGLVKVLATCEHVSFPDPPYQRLTRFRFIAEAGHTYFFSKRGSGCLQLLDATANDQRIACGKQTGGYIDYSSGVNTALIHTGDANASLYCAKLNKVGSPEWAIGGLLEIDAGPFMVEVACYIGGLIRRLRTSKFDFVAEPGHTYTFRKSEKKCIRLVDVTAAETVVACEPYEEAE